MNAHYATATMPVDRAFTGAVVAERHFRYFAPRLPNALLSGVLGFGMAVCLLAASAAGMRSGIIGFFALTAATALLFPHAVLRSNVRNAWLWLFPAWALFSSQWSIDSGRTVHQAMLLIPTIAAGIMLGGMPRRRAIGAGAALALGGYIAYSLGAGASIMFSDTGDGGEALLGITTGKNYFGHIAATCLIMSPMLLAVARGPLRTPLLAIFAVVAAAGAFALVKSHATGSLLATAIAFMVMAVVLSFRRVPSYFKIVLLAAIVGVVILYVNFGEELQRQLFEMVLTTFKKDVSLTGRTVLWDHADRLIAERNMLGVGYGAFWYYTNPEAWTLWRMMGVMPMSGFNFHNTIRDILIETGMVGLAMYLVGFGYPLVRATIRGLRRGDLQSAIGLGFLTYFIVRMPVETTGIGGVSIDTILILTFLCRTVTETAKPPAVPAPAYRRSSDTDGAVARIAVPQRGLSIPSRGR